MDDQVMKSVSVGDEGIYAAMHTSLLSYLRTDGKTGLGFVFHVLDFDKPEGDADRLKELHIAMNDDKWLASMLIDLLDYYGKQKRRNNRTEKELRKAIIELAERMKSDGSH